MKNSNKPTEWYGSKGDSINTEFVNFVQFDKKDYDLLNIFKQPTNYYL